VLKNKLFAQFFFSTFIFLFFSSFLAGAEKSPGAQTSNSQVVLPTNAPGDLGKLTNILRYVLDPEIVGTEASWDHMEFASAKMVSANQWELTPFVIVNTNGEAILTAASLNGKLNIKKGGFVNMERSKLAPAALKILEKWFVPMKKLDPAFEFFDLSFLIRRLGDYEGSTEMTWTLAPSGVSTFNLKETIKPYLDFSLEVEAFTNHPIHPSHWSDEPVSNRSIAKQELKSFLEGRSVFAGPVLSGLKQFDAVGDFSSQNLSTFQLAAEMGLTNGLVPFILYQPCIPKQISLSAKVHVVSDVLKKKLTLKDTFFEIKPLVRFDVELSYTEVGEESTCSNRLDSFSLVLQDLGIREVIWTLAGGLWGSDRNETQNRLGVVADQLLAQLEAKIGQPLGASTFGLKDFVTKEKKNKLEVKMNESKTFFFKANTRWLLWLSGLTIK
jgi:hypothetical protein